MGLTKKPPPHHTCGLAYHPGKGRVNQCIVSKNTLVKVALWPYAWRVYFGLMLSWLDLIALLVLSAALGVGIRQGVPFTLAAIPALLLYVVLAPWVGPLLPLTALPFLALALGLGMAYVSHFIPMASLSPTLEGIIGGIGGLVWGLFLAATIWVSFPSEFVASSGALRYPSEQIPSGVKDGIVLSPFARPLFDWAAGNPVIRAALLPHINHP